MAGQHSGDPRRRPTRPTDITPNIRPRAQRPQIGFEWVGNDSTGARVTGECMACTPAMARAQLRVRGITPIRVRKRSKPWLRRPTPKITAKDITLFCRQLAALLTAGVPLVQGLDIIATGHDHPGMGALLVTIRNDILHGRSLADALHRHPRHFDTLFCNLVRCGEASGALESLLQRLAAYRESSAAIRAKLHKALLYPAVVLVIAMLVSAVLLLFVIPKFQALFDGFGAELPGLTQAVITLSTVFRHQWPALCGGPLLALWLLLSAGKRSPQWARRIDRILLGTPALGALLTKVAIARYARTLSTLFAAGIPLTDAMHHVAGTVGSPIYSDAIERMRNAVSTGQRLNVAMAQTRRFPPMAVQMIAIGEESGALDTLLNKVADFYEQDVNDAVDYLSTLIEPLVMALLGGLLGGLIIAMYLPIFQISTVI